MTQTQHELGPVLKCFILDFGIAGPYNSTEKTHCVGKTELETALCTQTVQ